MRHLLWTTATAVSAVLVTHAARAQAKDTLAARATAAHDTISTYRLRILGVYDAESGAPLSGADVANLQTGVSSATNASGLVYLAFLPDGGGMVRIRKVGYTPVTRFIAVSPVDTAPVTEVLSATSVTLPTVTTQDSSPRYISPGLQGFEKRRHLGIGHFITEAELRKKDDVAFNNVVAMLPGLMVNCPPRGFPYSCYAVSTRMAKSAFSGPPMCPISVYQDGIPVTDTDLTRMHTFDFGAVEFYASGSEAPIEYNATGNACGVLLLWTRER